MRVILILLFFFFFCEVEVFGPKGGQHIEIFEFLTRDSNINMFRGRPEIQHLNSEKSFLLSKGPAIEEREGQIFALAFPSPACGLLEEHVVGFGSAGPQKFTFGALLSILRSLGGPVWWGRQGLTRWVRKP